MPVAIRLSRVGRKDLPFYRLVVVDSRKKRDGESLEVIGSYDGFKSRLITFKPERYDAWLKLGAQPSDTAKKLYRLFKKEGIAAVKPSQETKASAFAKASDYVKTSSDTSAVKEQESSSKAKKRTAQEVSLEKVSAENKDSSKTATTAPESKE